MYLSKSIYMVLSGNVLVYADCCFSAFDIMHRHINACIHACTYIYVYTYTYTYIYTCIRKWIHTCVPARVTYQNDN